MTRLSRSWVVSPCYAQEEADSESLMAFVVTQAMNHGNHLMARIIRQLLPAISLECSGWPDFKGDK